VVGVRWVQETLEEMLEVAVGEKAAGAAHESDMTTRETTTLA